MTTKYADIYWPKTGALSIYLDCHNEMSGYCHKQLDDAALDRVKNVLRLMDKYVDPVAGERAYYRITMDEWHAIVEGV